MREEIQQAYRLSVQQRHLWLAQAEGDLDYAQCVVRIEGSLEPQVLRRAFLQAVASHEILRTGFRRQPGRKLPLQVVSDAGEPSWISWDDDAVAQAAARAGDWASLLARHRSLPLDLAAASLLRLTLLSLSRREHLLVVTLPTLCADARTLANLLAEVVRTCAGGQPAVAPVQYVDFSQWQDELLEEDGDAARAAAFWQGFDLECADLRFPFETRTAPAVPFRHETRTLSLPPTRAREIEETAALCGASLEIFLLACWQVLLRRMTGRPAPLIGRVCDGRKVDDLKSALGLFACLLPVATPPGDPPFRRYLELLQEAVDEASPWQEHWPPHRGTAAPGDDPELPVTFESLDDRSTPNGHDPTFSLARREVGMGRFRLKLRGVRTDRGLDLELQLVPGLLPAEEVGRWLERLDALLGAALADPGRPAGDLDLLGPTERRELLKEFNRTARPFTGELVHRRFEQQAAQTPRRVAVVCEERALTFEDLNRRANQLAHHLRSLDVGPEERVALFFERSEESIVALLGVLKAGGAYVPLDPSFPPDRIAAMLEDSETGVVVTQTALLSRLPGVGTHCVCLDRDAESLARCGGLNPAGGATAESLSYVLFTSGSTGRPKGVAVEHRQLANYLDAVLERIEAPPGASFATVSTLAADLGNTMIFPSLCTGGSLHILAQDRASDAVGLAEYFIRHGVDCLKIVPSHLSALLKTDQAAELLPRRRLVLGGDASTWDLVEQVERLVPDCRIFNHYGPTETTVGVMVHPVERERGPGSGLRLPLGRPLANCSIHLLDERLHTAPLGVDAELYIGGRNLARGYLGRPDLTAERFLPNPFSAEPGGRLYRTGDVARFRAAGHLEFVGRADRQVKIRGFRIEPGEIEAVLVQHPAIWEAVVVVARQEGAQEKRLVAYLVPRPGKRPSGEELRESFRGKLADYMVPSAFVLLPALPLTANGKVDLRALPSPAQERPETARELTAPRTSAEQALVAIWSEVLGFEQVGIHENFFDLGGDSILAIQVIARANQAGLRLSPKHLFEHQTIAALAGVAGTAPEIQAEQGPLQGMVPLTPIQHWFFAQELADPHHWNQSLLFELTRSVPAQLVECAAARLVEHHDALRIRFRKTSGGWQQSITGPDHTSSAFLCADLSALPAAAESAALEAFAADLQASLDLQRGPLLRIALLGTGQGRPARILIVVHHLVVDGVSWRILLEDFTSLCERLCRGEPLALPAKTTSFRQWSEKLYAHARSEALQRELEHWLAVSPRHRDPLPVDLAGSDTVASEGKVTTTLGADETRALLQEVTAAYRVQINDVLPAALARAWTRWCGQPSLLLELEGHGREDLFEDVDLSRTVGWFTTHFPVRLTPGAADDSGATLQGVKETLRGIPHRGIGYGLLRFLAPAESSRQLAELPEPEVKLNYLGQLDRGLATAPSTLQVLGPAGPSHSPRSRRPWPLAIDAGIVGGQLHLTWRYGRHRFHEATIERLALAMNEELRSLVAHCQTAGAGGCTSSDFPWARLDQPQLDRLLATLQAPEGAVGMPAHRWVEDIYPASPLQKSLLSHLLAMPATTVGFEQKSSTLSGEIDPDVFGRVWQSLVDRHPILRTAFVWDGVDELRQVVSRRAVLPLERQDWRQLPAAERSARLAAFLAADRERGFDPSRAPLLRLALLRLTDSTWQLVWSYSHLLLDAWCRTLVLREAFSCYGSLLQGEEPRLPSTRPYRDYIVWLQHREMHRAAQFWRDQLAGIPGATPFRVEWFSEPAPAADTYASVAETLPTAILEVLQGFAQRHKVTLNTLFLGGWGVLLSRYSGTPDVVFGSTVSGRPAELPGVDSMIGLFINNLPVRVQVPGEARVAPWLQDLQRRLMELREFEFCSIDQIREWSGLSWGQRLFESLLLFQNYPVDDLAPKEEVTGVEVLSYHGRLETSYPITVVVAPSSSLRLEIFYQTTRFDAATLARMLRHLVIVVESLTAASERPLTEISLLAGPERQQILVEWSGALPSAPQGSPHGFLAARVRDLMELGLQEGDVLVSALLAPAVWATELRVAIAAGLRVVAVDPEAAADPRRLRTLLEDVRPRGLQAHPATLHQLVESGWPGVPDLTVLATGGFLTQGLAARLLARSASVHGLYGTPEIGAAFAAQRVKGPAGPGALFRPLGDCRLHLLARDLEPVPVGVPGELWIGGAGPSGELLSRTGDLARFLPNGDLELLGRLVREESHDGFPHFGIVEAALRRHPAVVETAVRSWEDESGDRRLAAYVVAGGTTPPAADELRAFVRAKLPRSMVPALFVYLDVLPRTPQGEIERAALPPPDQAGSRTHAAFIPPRDPLELMLVQIWEELFGIHPLGIRDDFFELGGYSLLAIQLLEKIPGHFGRRLPLSAILQAGTVEKMAQILRQEVDSRPWTPLVELQAGGAHKPLFCVHPLGGEVLCYRDLATALGAAQPFFALQARGWEDDLEPHDSVEEMAACYLEALREVQPEGPYDLAGWSFGGLVALEMAQQLKATGQEVGLLAILDTTVDPPPPVKATRFEKLVRFEQEHPLLPFSEMWELASREESLAFELEEIKRAFRVPAGLDPQTVRRYQRAGESLGRVKEKYRPQPYTGRITLFRAAKGHILYAADPTFGWNDLALGGLDIIEVPGSHNDMVYRPYVQELAAQLRDRLDRVRRLKLQELPPTQPGPGRSAPDAAAGELGRQGEMR